MAIRCIKGVARLRGFSYKKMYGCFKKTAHNNEVIVTQGSTINEMLRKPLHWLK